ncbi:MAG: hypothetical protein ACUVX8_19365 [Candidatus Zipacnadales bacterium]
MELSLHHHIEVLATAWTGIIAMDDDALCHCLEQLASRLQVNVRYEPSAGKAGYCVLNGERTIFIDPRMTLQNRAAALARLLSPFDCEGIFLPPTVRNLLEAYRSLK